MKTVLLLLSTDRFSFPLIRYLIVEGRRFGWKTCVASMFDNTILDRIKAEKISSDLGFIHITDFRQCDHAIRKADLVIGMVPDMMLLQIADSCIIHEKSLIAPSRLNRQMAAKRPQAEENDVLLLMECGFSPGLDHVTAKKAIDNIRTKGGEVVSFKTFSGSLIDKSCIDNPWMFKLTEPVQELISLGRQNNRHLIDRQPQHVPYHQLFGRSEPAVIKDWDDIVSVPEGDSLYYRKIYQLQEATTVLKGKLLRKGFDSLWNLVIRLGLTDNTSRIELLGEKSFHQFLNSLLPYSPTASTEYKLIRYAGATSEEIDQLKWLGLFDDEWLEGYKDLTPAVVLQHLMENKLSLRMDDRDCIMMQHQLEYTHKNSRHKFTATLVAQGENQQDSALAKAIGLTTGAAAKAFLMGDIKVKGLRVPTQKEIYDPILNELDDLGVAFKVEEAKVQETELNTVPAQIN